MKINVTENNMIYIRAIQDGHHTITEIVSRIGCNKTAAYGNIRALKARGVIGTRDGQKNRYYYLLHDKCQYIPCISEAGKTLPLGHPGLKRSVKGVRGRNDPPMKTNDVVEGFLGLMPSKNLAPRRSPLWEM